MINFTCWVAVDSDMIVTLDLNNEIFKKESEAHPIFKAIYDIKLILLQMKLLKGFPIYSISQSTTRKDHPMPMEPICQKVN